MNLQLYSSSSKSKVDASLDTRFLTKEGRKQIIQDYKDMDKNMVIISKTLPDANSDNVIEKYLGIGLDALGKYTGLVPSNSNGGGLLAKIPLLTGVDDSRHQVIKVTNKELSKFNEQDYIKLEDTSYYKSLSEKDKNVLAGQGLYISKQPLLGITKDNASYQNSMNGMMNNEAEAIKNGLQQTGQMNVQKGSPVELNVNYNPTYGLLPDILESAVNKLGLWSTGIVNQTQSFVQDTVQARDGDANFAPHSQGNQHMLSVLNNLASSGYKNPTNNTPSIKSYGSPVNVKDMNEAIDNVNFKSFGTHAKDGDFVAESFGRNKGSNEQSSFTDIINVFNAVKLFTSDSPHSTYICQDYANAKGCGFKQ